MALGRGNGEVIIPLLLCKKKTVGGKKYSRFKILDRRACKGIKKNSAPCAVPQPRRGTKGKKPTIDTLTTFKVNLITKTGQKHSLKARKKRTSSGTKDVVDTGRHTSGKIGQNEGESHGKRGSCRSRPKDWKGGGAKGTSQPFGGAI